MLNQVTVNHKRSAWLTACFLLGAWVIVLLPFTTFGQDKIHKTDNSILEAKVLEINKTEIKYKKFSNQNGPAYIIPITEVSMIVYENGEKEVYNQVKSAPTGNAANGSGSPASNSTHSKARNYILTENIKEAISSYGKLIKADLTNPVLLAEDAYALALAGIYDAALLRLDQCRSLGAISPEINYFTAQVFGLMGYIDLAGEFWKPSSQNIPPAWIAAKASLLLQKYRSKTPVTSTRTREQLIANFKHANELASQTQYFQSIALFHDIVNIYPNEYLPYVGYSITLEKTGALGKSAQSIEKAISLIGNTSEDIAKKQLLEKRLATLKQNMTILPPYTAPEMPVLKAPVVKGPQMMAYAGGMVAPYSTNINGRIGYFISGSSNASIDFGMWKSAEYTASNVGLSIYNRQKSFVSGAGLLMNSANGNSAFSFKLSVGFSKMNKARTSSFDIFLDMNKGFKTDALTTFCFSIGTSKYFGKRK